MKRKLIINTEQFNRINEALAMHISGEEGVDPNTTFNNYANQANLSPDTTVTVDSPNDEGSLVGSTVNGDADNSNSEVSQAYDDGADVVYPVSESFTLSKKEARILSKLNEEDSVYSKKSFKKALSEEYSDFNTRLNNRRKNK